MNLRLLRPRIVLDSIKAAGYATFEGAEPYDLNIFGIRSSDSTPNVFNDAIGCVYRCDALHWHCEAWAATTDPGLYYLENPMSADGCAILVPGQYRGAYMQGLHAGLYNALVQTGGPVTIWRDNDRDGQLDFGGPTDSGYFGINIHRATSSGTSVTVDNWSAGCQVVANSDDFARLMWLVGQQAVFHPTWTRYTYTLLTEDELKI